MLCKIRGCGAGFPAVSYLKVIEVEQAKHQSLLVHTDHGDDVTVTYKSEFLVRFAACFHQERRR